MNWEWLEGIPYFVPTAVWGPGGKETRASQEDAGLLATPQPGEPQALAAQALPPQGRGSWMTCLISQLTPSFSARPPRNEICQGKRSVS